MKTLVLTDHHIPEARCPRCKTMNDGAMGGSTAPVPGDLSVCIACASPLIFNIAMQLQALSEEDIRKLHPEEERNLRAAISLVTENLKEIQGRPH